MVVTSKTRIREELLLAAREAENLGYSPPMTGNFSYFDRGSDIIYITPSQLNRFLLEPSDILVMMPDGEMVYNPNHNSPSIETRMHLAIYEQCPGVNAVFHTHKADSQAAKAGAIPYYEPGSAELADAVRLYLKERCSKCRENEEAGITCLELTDHGYLILGRDIRDALHNLILKGEG